MVRQLLAPVALAVMALAVGRAADEAPKPPARPKADAPAWEYKAVRFPPEEGAATKRLNELAAEGWEYAGPLPHGLVAFKRRARAAGGPAEKPPEALVVGIDAAGRITVGGEEVALKDLKGRLEGLKKKGGDAAGVEVRAAAQTPYAKVVELMDELRRAGYKEVRLRQDARKD